MTDGGAAPFIPADVTGGRLPRLLVVDDQPVNVRAIFQLFDGDCQVFMATCGEQALARCRDRQPDLVLLDVKMPGMDGYEVCRRLKADPATQDIPVIFLTAHRDEASETRGLDAGAVDFICRPIHPAVVRARVRSHAMLKLQSDRLRQMVFVDGLTGVFNRRHFDERLEAEWGRALRNRSELCLLMIDVDHFKDYNDRHGHPAGDAALRFVAEILRRCIRRSGDVIARYGGEEFACILPETEPTSAMLLARMIEQRIRRAGDGRGSAADAVAGVAPLTVSIGVAAKPVDVDPRTTRSADLLALADLQLYAAKSAGRACIKGKQLGAADALPVPALSLAGTEAAEP
jgi:diguanylate cyclase (GGDEF)-like protein